MKSQRRHELQTNYLADHLGTAAQASKPFAMWVTIAVAAVVVLGIGYGIYASQTHKANSEAWGEYYFNIGTGDAEVFRQVAEDHPNTSAAHWAQQAWADNQLMIGLDQIYTNRKEAEENIQRAIDAYNDVLKSADEEELKNRAAIGLAQAYESIGKLDDATRYYQQVASSGPGPFANMANERLLWIKSGEGKSFYEWFASVRSTPAPPPALPSDLSQPPTMPDLSFPQKQNPLTLPGATEGAASTQPTPGEPASDAAKPGETPSQPAAEPTKAAEPAKSAEPEAAKSPASDESSAEAPKQ
ncbi:MAG: hypothetical protein ACTHK7_17790 [Aureliella sp.]